MSGDGGQCQGKMKSGKQTEGSWVHGGGEASVQ